jgi:oxygen-independent coproporphyrinogen-3 oxidase
MNSRGESEAGLDVPCPERIAPLIPKYDRPGPRYTSYPPAPIWTDDFGPAQYRDALAAVDGGEISVYVHIPFCESLCTYCACNREINRDHSVANPYLDALEREADAVASAMGASTQCVQLALGGGTPTYLDETQLERLCDILDSHFPPAAGAERSIEVDPRVTTSDQLELLSARGFNRISLGVQDLSPKVQQAIHRVQSLEQTEAIVGAARSLGFRSVNLDLIYGLPYQTEASFDETLRQVIAMRADRIALYSYAHVTWVSKQQRGFEKKDLPSAAAKLAIFLLAMRRLGDAGYRFLGLDHFALPDDDLSKAAESGDLRRNFMGYTTRAALDLVALGASGISELSNAYAQSERSNADWQKRIDAGDLPTMRGWWLTDTDLRRRWLIQHLMCQGEIDPEAYARSFGEPLSAHLPSLEERLEPFVEDGLLVSSGSGFRLTPLGRLFLRPIAMVFDAYLDGEGESDQPRYSRTI